MQRRPTAGRNKREPGALLQKSHRETRRSDNREQPTRKKPQLRTDPTGICCSAVSMAMTCEHTQRNMPRRAIRTTVSATAKTRKSRQWRHTPSCRAPTESSRWAPEEEAARNGTKDSDSSHGKSCHTRARSTQTGRMWRYTQHATSIAFQKADQHTTPRERCTWGDSCSMDCSAKRSRSPPTGPRGSCKWKATATAVSRPAVMRNWRSCSQNLEPGRKSHSKPSET